MHSSDRPDFEARIGELFAGFPGSGIQTRERTEAYWKGLQKLGLVELGRLIDYALGEHGPDRLPSVPQLWRMRADMRRAPREGLPSKKPLSPDHLEFFANRLVWHHVRTRGGLGSAPQRPSDELEQVLALRRDLVAEFREYVLEGDDLATPAEFCRRWLAALRSISTPTPKHIALIEGFQRRETSHAPFPSHLVRPLTPADYGSAA